MKISFNPLVAEAIHIFREVAAEAENGKNTRRLFGVTTSWDQTSDIPFYW